ncbi:MAG: DUF962 domain-containing protein [Bacteriovorax sp.]|jgi:hypothetical protein
MNSFDEFWPKYLNAHAHPKNRKLHFIGMVIVHLILLYVFITGHIKVLWLVPVFGIGFAWAGRTFVEKNHPLTYKHPLWSMLAELRIFYSSVFRRKVK